MSFFKHCHCGWCGDDDTVYADLMDKCPVCGAPLRIARGTDDELKRWRALMEKRRVATEQRPHQVE